MVSSETNLLTGHNHNFKTTLPAYFDTYAPFLQSSL